MNRVITNMFFIRETSTKVPRCCAFEIETSAEYVLEDVAGFGFASKAENDSRAFKFARKLLMDHIDPSFYQGSGV